MRPGQQNKRGRGRNNSGGNNNRKGQNPLSRSYDSSGPDVKIRGTAQTIADKYMSLARDSQSSGDRVMAENYLQHAEHYNRIIAAAQAQLQERNQRDDRDGQRDDRQAQSRDDDNGNTSNDDAQSHNGENGRGGRQAGRADETRSAERNRDEDTDRSDERGGDQGGNEARDRDAGPRKRRSSPKRNAVEPDAPQPVIEGVPAEVALEQQETSADASGGQPAPRRRGRPRRVKTSDKDDQPQSVVQDTAEATAAE
ncbi:DUF4167 domain-containing protein [Pseudohoeflea coraliihabitans]|uniref:DUF4167 domain-containing protein n=1 Tax=Pseudohoeflea coraliihabitans TaxID=2860393 RepID=A0ABS6WMY7_9HYPH|nr:DUF4167 domain-containing protein [Pseudohoeflea sp. DP4N28-3]MBW3096465.1 DUF4167 domain-containing protein [Pseudohoeflea sp. DP4N28-3]